VATSPGPGPLAIVHRLTIWTALCGALAYVMWEATQLAAGWHWVGAARAVLALMATVGIAVYLRSLRGLAARLTPGNDRTSGS
jgi:hypothetical protein